jgi:hypothetical protein
VCGLVSDPALIQHLPISLNLLHWQIRVVLAPARPIKTTTKESTLSEDSPLSIVAAALLLRFTQPVTGMSE